LRFFEVPRRVPGEKGAFSGVRKDAENAGARAVAGRFAQTTKAGAPGRRRRAHDLIRQQMVGHRRTYPPFPFPARDGEIAAIRKKYKAAAKV
jgi:hypothetical protein